jgi:nucleotidyltransferase substrate binding protein (TIGR01987 family)
MEEISKWENKLENFEKANAQLQKALLQKDYNDLEREGVIKRFEFTFELGWKTLQDYIEAIGHEDVKGPRKVIKRAFADNIISDGQGWINMLDSRLESVHTYSEPTIIKIFDDIKSLYGKLLNDLVIELKSQNSI